MVECYLQGLSSEQAEAAMLVLRTSAARSVSGPETHPGSGGEPVLVEEAAEQVAPADVRR
jgi:hypothetical protein